MAGKIIIELEGDHADHGDIRLGALAEQLESLRKALTYAEQHAAIGGKRTAIYYRVVDLHHSKPTLEIEAVAEDPLDDRTSAVIYEFSTRLRQIHTGTVPDNVPVEELEAYGEIAPKPERHMRGIVIGFDAPTAIAPYEPLRVTREFEEKVAALIGPEEVAWGTMTGFLDALNLHERNVFYLWPRVGPKRLHCTFNRIIRDDVKAAIEHYVQASGRIHYRRRDDAARSMSSVYNVEVLDAAPEGSRLSDLRGIAPEITGGMDTRDFVDSYDEDW
jgi:hypothetical protein